jgi:lipopolysaccharide assembly protein A
VKYLMWLLNAALFFVLFAFALNNQDKVTLHLFFGARWQAPMVVVVLLSMLVGVFLGVVAMVPLWLRAKKARQRSGAGTASTAFGNDTTLLPSDPIERRHGL